MERERRKEGNRDIGEGKQGGGRMGMGMEEKRKGEWTEEGETVSGLKRRKRASVC